jgi:hypothetical protein
MSWSTALPALLSLAGVGLGAVATLVGQYLTTLNASRQARAERAAARRAERKEAIVRFLDVAQDVEKLAEDIYNGFTDRKAADGRLTHQLWLAQKIVDLMCSEQLRKPTFEFTQLLHVAVWTGPPEGKQPWEYLGDARWAYMQAARHELGVDADTLHHE